MSSQVLIVFGDGLMGIYYDEKSPYLNREGVRMQPILLVPQEELKDRYGLTGEDLNIETDDNQQAIWMDYPVKQIKWLSKTRVGTVLIMCSFNGGKTDLMDYYKGLLEWDTQRDINESRLKMQVSALSRDLEDITSNQLELARKTKELTEIYNENTGDDDDDN